MVAAAALCGSTSAAIGGLIGIDECLLITLVLLLFVTFNQLEK